MARNSRRLVASLLMASAAVVAVSACSPIVTQYGTAPSDGIQVEIGDQIRGENLLILSPAEGAEGVLIGALVNRWESPTTVSLSVGESAEAVTVEVDGGSTVLLEPDHEHVTIASVPAAPGATIDVILSSPEEGSVSVAVPVLDGTLAPYDELVPAAPEEE
ncbi:hypothetical protein EXU48_12460 [Occultella glacieicola]|uniref:Lipoprotein n=1 Tax=Occultella glacieicola TaxID=2518684 RepID=A0ABY2E3N3_9MICO|nr:hypothetical protein [Occultella glacieicola]TDE94239.1 hypothetical protein EXU48_12460 [Occultella glacieicola]